MGILLDILTIVLVLVSVFLILVILMQRGNANGGLGAAMGGGAAESAFGAETSNVLSKVTRNTAIVFFVMVFGIGLGRIWVNSNSDAADGEALPEFDLPAAATDEAADSGLNGLIGDAEETATDATEENGEALQDAAAVAEETVGEVEQAVEETVEQAEETAEETVPPAE